MQKKRRRIKKEPPCAQRCEQGDCFTLCLCFDPYLECENEYNYFPKKSHHPDRSSEQFYISTIIAKIGMVTMENKVDRRTALVAKAVSPLYC